AELYDRRQPTSLARRQAPLPRELRGDRASGEPERHAQQFGAGKERQHAPAGWVLILGRRELGRRRHATPTPNIARPTESRSSGVSTSRPACIATTRVASASTSSRSLE